jgi:uncharacterized ubiquitin-like protein YukD
MKLLVLCPGKIPKSVNDIRCFTEVVNYYLPQSLSKFTELTVEQIPSNDTDKLKSKFNSLDVDRYDAILTLGLRFYSKISLETTQILRSKFKGLLCQIHDGSRLDYDPVDITFTFKNDDYRLSINSGWYRRHKKFNAYMGWAADPNLNYPNQDPEILRILVDHTNYGDNEIDKTLSILREIKSFVDSNIWKEKYNSVSVRRFDSGKVVEVDLSDLSYEKYDRSKTMPLSEISKEHSAAHIFCVTHPESVGMVVLETALAGAYIVTPENFIPKDRLQTVRHYEWKDSINWQYVLDNIDIDYSRKVASLNTWNNVANNIINELQKRTTQRC